MAKCAEELKMCNVRDRMAMRRCQAEMMSAVKPMLILAAEAAGNEVRSHCLEALIQTTDGNTELAALIGSSGVFDLTIARALKAADDMAGASSYMDGVLLELLVAKAVPEARVHMQILPYVIRILQEGVLVEYEIRQKCVEVLTHLSYTHHRCRDVAAILPSQLLESLLEERGSKEETKTHSMSDEQKRKSISAMSDMGFMGNLDAITDEKARTAMNMMMKQFGDVVRLASVQGGGSGLVDHMDGHLFYIGLLMANLCDSPFPGTDRCFGSVAEPFWKRIMFFAGLGACLRAALQDAQFADGDHEPLHIVSTCVKLVSAGYAGQFDGMVGPLVDAIKLYSSAAARPAPKDLRIARLSAVVLRAITEVNKVAQSDLCILAKEDDESILRDALNAMAQEEPAAGDLLDLLSASAPNGMEALRAASPFSDESSNRGY